jgi:putative acetyltransferase
VNQQAFGTNAEAAIVDVVRAHAQPIISLVAEDEGEIVGHIMFSPVTLEPRPGVLAMGLAPMAVLPHRQRSGIGSALADVGLTECRLLGAVGVVVVGHPRFYPRFGFAAASRFGLTCEFEVPDDVFMAIELVEHAFSATGGRIRYHPAFSGT